MESGVSIQPTLANQRRAQSRFNPSSWLAWSRAALRRSARPLLTALCFFLLPFVKWFAVPSPFAAAMLLSKGERPTVYSLMGLSASLVLRLLWGVDADSWQYAGCLLLWLALLWLKPQPGVETAALGGLSMMPRAIGALMNGEPLSILLAVAAVPLGMLFSAWLRYGLSELSSGSAAPRTRERAAVSLLCLLLMSALGYFRVFSVNLGQAAAVLCTVCVAHGLGCAYGAAGGLCCGLALAFGGHDCRVAFSLSLIGLVSGVAPARKHRLLTAPLPLLGNALAFYLTPLLAPPLPYLTALLGGLLFALMPKRACAFCSRMMETVPQRANAPVGVLIGERVSHLREAIEEIAKALPKNTEPALSGGAELGALLCSECVNRELCWGRSRARTEKMLTLMMEHAKNGEPIDEDKLPALSQHGCLRAEAIGDTAREARIVQQKRAMRQRRALYERGLTLTHLAAMAGTLTDLSLLASGESLDDLQAAHTVRMALDELRTPAKLRYARRVDGHLQIALQAEGVLPIQKPLETLLRYLDTEEEMPLSISRAEKGHIELEEIPLYSAALGTASICAGQRAGDGEPDVCGDACSAKRCEGGRLIMILCDGMGHGQAAHAQSEKTLELLLLLLQAGYSRRQAITAVNGIMLGSQTETERFSTVDLADVDLWTGEVCCEKLGACPTWMIRGNHMKKVDASSLPLGIMEEAKPTAIQYRLHSGDILVMMSDGVADALGDDGQMQRALEESLYIQPQRMADALLRSALLASDGTPKDDMTVMVLLLMDRRRG